MNKILLSSDVIALLFTESTILIIASVAFIWGIKIYKKWDFNSLENSQYILEKKSYFATIVITFTLFTKFFLLLFFAGVIDNLSNIVPGAMCAAGVISSNDFGMIIFAIKLFILFFSVCWIIMNKIDLDNNYIFIKRKFELFFLIYILLCFELFLQILFFTNISTDLPVMCCSVIYGVSEIGSAIPFYLDKFSFFLICLIVFFMLLIALKNKKDKLSFIIGLLFLYLGYYFTLHIIGIYVYELPTHICPFCMLQKEYGYIGYLIWISLFFGTFFAMAPFVLNVLIQKNNNLAYNIALLFNILFVVIAIFYIIGFYIKNGVWL